MYFETNLKNLWRSDNSTSRPNILTHFETLVAEVHAAGPGMAARHLLLLWLALAAAQCGGASIWGWLLPSWAGGGDAGDGSGSARLAHAPGVDVPEVHFETKSVEDKFIDAVQRYEGRVSDLDACQHKVCKGCQQCGRVMWQLHSYADLQFVKITFCTQLALSIYGETTRVVQQSLDCRPLNRVEI